jgi:hypothetical protein
MQIPHPDPSRKETLEITFVDSPQDWPSEDDCRKALIEGMAPEQRRVFEGLAPEELRRVIPATGTDPSYQPLVSAIWRRAAMRRTACPAKRHGRAPRRAVRRVARVTSGTSPSSGADGPPPEPPASCDALQVRRAS